MKNGDFIAWHVSPYTFDRFDFSKLRDGLGVFVMENREAEEYYARWNGRFPNGAVRQDCLTFRNVLRVRQGEEYAKCVARRDGEKTSRDVRRRLIKAGYDGIRVEYHDGLVEHVAFSNRNIKHVSDNVHHTLSKTACIKILENISVHSRQRWDEEEVAGQHKKVKKLCAIF